MSQKGTGYFLFCIRCGTAEAPNLKPKLTLRVRYLRVDAEGTLYLNCTCVVCFGTVEIPWTVEEHLKAIEDVKSGNGLTEDEVEQFTSELDNPDWLRELNQMGDLGEEE